MKKKNWMLKKIKSIPDKVFEFMFEPEYSKVCSAVGKAVGKAEDSIDEAFDFMFEPGYSKTCNVVKKGVEPIVDKVGDFIEFAFDPISLKLRVPLGKRLDRRIKMSGNIVSGGKKYLSSDSRGFKIFQCYEKKVQTKVGSSDMVAKKFYVELKKDNNAPVEVIESHISGSKIELKVVSCSWDYSERKPTEAPVKDAIITLKPQVKKKYERRKLKLVDLEDLQHIYQDLEFSRIDDETNVDELIESMVKMGAKQCTREVIEKFTVQKLRSVCSGSMCSGFIITYYSEKRKDELMDSIVEQGKSKWTIEEFKGEELSMIQILYKDLTYWTLLNMEKADIIDLIINSQVIVTDSEGIAKFKLPIDATEATIVIEYDEEKVKLTIPYKDETEYRIKKMTFRFLPTRFFGKKIKPKDRLKVYSRLIPKVTVISTAVILGLLAVTDLLCDYAILSGALALAISSEWYIIGTALLFISSIVLYWYLIRIWTDSVHNQFKEKEKRV